MNRNTAAKVALIAGALAIAFLAGKETLAFAMASRDPQLALKLNPRQSDALASIAYSAISESPNPEKLARVERQALLALRIDPTNVSAAVSLAIARASGQSSRDAPRMMEYAQSLSRRNLATHLWWIEYWANLGDVSRTLEHYDIAMRTSRSAPSILFPILVSAVADPIVSRRLADVLAGAPPWGEQFVQQLAQSGTDPNAVERLFVDMVAAGRPAPDPTLATAIDRMIETGHYSQARSLFAAYRPADASSAIRNAHFSAAVSEPTRFDWKLGQGTISAAITADGLQLDASSGAGDVGATQVVALAPGRHTIELAYGAAAGNEAAEPILSVQCVQGGDVLGRSALVGAGLIELRFVVPAACPLQRLQISLNDAEGLRGSSSLVKAVRLID